MSEKTMPEPMRIIVCGGRNYNNQAHLFAWLDKFHARFGVSELIEGGARGADRLAFQWACRNDVKVVEVLAKWNRFNRRAGSLRNQEMLDLKPDAVVAFPGNVGTAHMVNLAKKAGVKVYDGASREWLGLCE